MRSRLSARGRKRTRISVAAVISVKVLPTNGSTPPVGNASATQAGGGQRGRSQRRGRRGAAR